MKATFVKRKPTVEQAEDSRSSDPILPLAIAYVLTIVVLTAICAYFSGDPIVSIVLLGFGVTGAIRFMLHVLAPLMLLRPLGMGLNYAVAAHRRHCECGTPAWKFMGLLGRTYCYRCSTCGRLLRLRD